jgi:DNA (cytosine-5)-methyltransferase 1
MKHLGDISKINGAEIEPVDVITFGSPCQDLSVAGKRAGLKHEANGDEETTRSGLFMESVRIIKEMREATNGLYPRFAFWENVPGAFSSQRGEDLRIVLEELCKIVEPAAVMPPVPDKGWAYADSYTGDGWSLAYRVFDAQYWGVPQRRRRIHLIVDFRGECARKILFEREGLRGYFEEGRTPWEGTAPDAQGSLRATDREGESKSVGLDIYNSAVTGDVAASLTTATGQGAANTGPSVAVPVTFEPGIAAREGGHIYEGVSGTIRANAGDNRMAVCYPDVVDGHILDDQGGSQITVREDGKSPTLRAEMHGNVPCVLDSAGFKARNGAKAHGIGYQEEVAPTLGTDQSAYVCAMAYSVENHPADSRVNIDESGKMKTLTSRMGTGGGNLQGNGIDRADTAGCNGKGVREDVCYTLNTIDRPAVAYAISSKQQSLAVSENRANTLGANDYKEPQVIALDRASFNQGQNAKYDFEISENGINSTLTARGPSAVAYWDGGQTCGTLTANNAGENQRMPDKDNFNCVIVQDPQYIVRRLTPTECARLQGFPDWWGHIAEKDDMTDEEYRFWCKALLEYAEIQGTARPNENGDYEIWREVKPDKKKGEDFDPYWENTGKPYKDKTKKQMLTWYNKLHTDSAEYKMWGNGIALPPALYCMQGIMEVLNAEKAQEETTEEPVNEITEETTEETTEAESPLHDRNDSIDCRNYAFIALQAMNTDPPGNDNIQTEKEDELMATTTTNAPADKKAGELEIAQTPEDFNALEHLYRLKDKQEKLGQLLHKEQFADDVRALEYAITVLEAVGL